jgi:hypothetical protein
LEEQGQQPGRNGRGIAQEVCSHEGPEGGRGLAEGEESCGGDAQVTPRLHRGGSSSFVSRACLVVLTRIGPLARGGSGGFAPEADDVRARVTVRGDLL